LVSRISDELVISGGFAVAIHVRKIQTNRLEVHVRESGVGGVPVVLLHGNCASGAFFEELMAALPAGFRAVVPDLRGYGYTEALPVDATRGCGDWSDDLHALAEALDLPKFHLAGWSLGGGVVMRYAVDHPERLLSVTLIDPVSPYGFGGTKDAAGTPTTADFAGCGGGCANPEFVKLMEAKDTTAKDPVSPRNTMNGFYFKPPFRGTSEQEDRWVNALLDTRVGPSFYPGDLVASANWPGVAPGANGFLNAISPKYHNVSGFRDIKPQPPVLWVRGDADQIVSDTSFFDLAFLGSVGYVPGWPGAEACPPQPMVAQTREILQAYQAQGGYYREVVIADAGHSPFIEKPEAFLAAFVKHLKYVTA